MTAVFGSEVLRPAPEAFHQGDGQPLLDGRYAGWVREVSTEAWDGNLGLLSPRRLQRKGWLYFGVFSEPVMMGFAVVDAGLIATAFVYVYDREGQTFVEEKAVVPLGFAARFRPSLRQPWSLKQGKKHWVIEPTEQGWTLSYSGQRLQVFGQVQHSEHGMTAVATSLGRPFAHTFKDAALSAALDVTLDGRRIVTSAGSTLDFTLGYPPRHTLWNWASMDGVTEDGQRFGLNVVAQFMNGLENALWLGEELIPLAQAVFAYDRQHLLAPWKVRTLDGRVSLTFMPEGLRQENLDVGLMASQFAQPFGRFEGRVLTAQGEKSVHGFGVVEAHRAVW